MPAYDFSKPHDLAAYLLSLVPHMQKVEWRNWTKGKSEGFKQQAGDMIREKRKAEVKNAI